MTKSEVGLDLPLSLPAATGPPLGSTEDDDDSSSMKSDITNEQSESISSLLSAVSLSQLVATEFPKLPELHAHMHNPSVIEHLNRTVSKTGPQKGFNKKKDENPEIADDKIYGRFTGEQIKRTFAFIRSSGLIGEDKSVEYVSMEDFWASVRRVKRAQNQRALEEEARKFMRTFRFLLQLANKTPEVWFVETDTTPDCKLSWSEFEAGMNKLCKDLGGAMFSKSGLQSMLRYMDPSCNGELTAPEVKAAFKRIKLPSVSSVILEESGPVFTCIQDYILFRVVRVPDVFSIFDIDNCGKISLQQFAAGVEKICEHVPALPDMSKSSSVDSQFELYHSVESKPVSLAALEKKLSISSFIEKKAERGKSTVRRRSILKSPIRVSKKAKIPQSNIRPPVIDSDRLNERITLLKNIEIPSLPPPIKVDRQKLMAIGAQRIEPWLQQFDKTLRRSIATMSEL
jgi:hypothetical protein